jgi:hypothetical protein
MSASGRVCPEADSIRVELAPAVPSAPARPVWFASLRTTLEHVPVRRRRSSMPDYLFHDTAPFGKTYFCFSKSKALLPPDSLFSKTT